jgi:NAD(P)-dependent dehydrogenase (short-subunit alcohol dehydrogenase family)
LWSRGAAAYIGCAAYPKEIASVPTLLVTGTSRGLGLELVRQYAADGWQIFACARRSAGAAELQALAAAHAGSVKVVDLDVEDHDAIDRLARELDGTAIDVLLNSAGIMGRGSFADEGIQFGRFGHADFDDWARVFRINVAGPMKMAEAFVEHVARSQQKKIVTLTSMLGSVALNRIGSLYAYRASKAAVNAMMKSMAIDLAKSHGIAATALHPGWVRTDLGGPRADIDPVTSVAGMRKVIAALTPDNAGRYMVYDGSELPW